MSIYHDNNPDKNRVILLMILRVGLFDGYLNNEITTEMIRNLRHATETNI